MSVIRDALRKEAEGGAAPSSPHISPTEQGKELKRGGPSGKKYWMIGVGSAVLFGFLMYYFSFSKPAPSPSPLRGAPPAVVVTPPSGVVSNSWSEKGLAAKVQPPISTARSGSFDPPEVRLSKTPETAAFPPPPMQKSVVALSPQGPSPKREQTKTKAGKSLSPGTPSAEPGPGKEAEEAMVSRLFNEAVQAQQQKDFPRAVQGYREVLALRAHHFESLNNLGLIYLEQQRYPAAREMFQKALNLHPRYLKAWNNLGLSYLQEGRLEEAGRQFQTALDLDPAFLPAWINLAAVANRQGQTDQARRYLLRVLDYDSENPEACYNLGLIWEKEGAENKAVEYYRRFIARDRGRHQELVEELKKRFPALR